MALNKSVTLPNGAVASYHQIDTVVSYKPGGYDLTVHGFANKAVREDKDGVPLVSRIYRVGAPAAEVLEGEEVVVKAVKAAPLDLNRTDLYDLLKQHPDFEGATSA